MPFIDYSKYTFVSSTFVSIKDDSSVIHVVPSIAEFNKKWDSRPITNSFQFSRKWYDMLDDEDDEKYTHFSDSTYFKAFLVGSIPSSLAEMSKFEKPLARDSKINPSLDVYNIDKPVVDNLKLTFKSIKAKKEPKKSDTSYIHKELKCSLKNKNTTSKNLYNSELFPESEELSQIDDSPYVYIDHTTESIKNIYSDLFINKDITSNNFIQLTINKAVTKNNNLNTNSKKKSNDKLSNVNSYESFLSYTTENFDKKLIPLSFDQVQQILLIINTPQTLKKPSKDIQATLNNPLITQFGYVDSSNLFPSIVPSVSNKRDANNSNINRNTVKNRESGTEKKISKRKNSSENKSGKFPAKIIKKQKNSKENLCSKDKPFQILKNKDLIPLSVASSSRINNSNKVTLSENNDNMSETSSQSYTNFSSTTKYLNQNDNSDTLSTISELSEPDETGKPSNHENIQVWCVDVDNYFKNLNTVFEENNQFKKERTTQDIFCDSFSIEKENNSKNLLDKGLKIMHEDLEIENKENFVKRNLDDYFNTTLLNDESHCEKTRLSNIIEDETFEIEANNSYNKKCVSTLNDDCLKTDSKDTLYFCAEAVSSSESLKFEKNKISSISTDNILGMKFENVLDFNYNDFDLSSKVQIDIQQKSNSLANSVLNSDIGNLNSGCDYNGLMKNEEPDSFFGETNGMKTEQTHKGKDSFTSANGFTKVYFFPVYFENDELLKTDIRYIRAPKLISKLDKSHTQTSCTSIDNVSICINRFEPSLISRKKDLIQKLTDKYEETVNDNSGLNSEENGANDNPEQNSSSNINDNPYPPQDKLTAMSFPSTVAKILQRDDKNPNNGSGSGSDGSIPNELKDVYGCCCCYWARIAQPSNKPVISIAQNKNASKNTKPSKIINFKKNTDKNKVTSSTPINGNGNHQNNQDIDRANVDVSLESAPSRNQLVSIENNSNDIERTANNKVSMGTVWSSAVLGFQNFTYNVMIGHFPVFTRNKRQHLNHN